MAYTQNCFFENKSIRLSHSEHKWAVSDSGSTSALHAEGKGSIPLWSTVVVLNGVDKVSTGVCDGKEASHGRSEPCKNQITQQTSTTTLAFLLG